LPVIYFTAIDNNIQTLPTLYIINDANCALCDDSWITESLSQSFNYTLERIDSSSTQGQQLINTLELTELPAVFLSSDFINNSAYGNFSNYLVENNEYYVLRVKGVKDLTKQESSTPTIDLFVMSECPYGTPAQENLINLKKTVPDFELNIHYIVDVQPESEMELSILQLKSQYDAACSDSTTAQGYGLECTDAEWQTYNDSLTDSCELKSNNNYYCSLHGPVELNLDIVQICAMNLSDNWGDFILEHINSNFNTAQAANVSGIDYNELMSCANSSKGLELLDANIALSNELGISASPTYIFDNVFTNPDVDSATALCTLHPTLSGCENIDSLEISASTGSC
jgi:hypothetical protein